MNTESPYSVKRELKFKPPGLTVLRNPKEEHDKEQSARPARGRCRRAASTFLLLLVLSACERIQEEPLAQIPERKCPVFEDDLDLKGLKEAVEIQMEYFRTAGEKGVPGHVHPAFSLESRRETLELLFSYLEGDTGAVTLDEFVRENFDVYRTAGSDGRGTVLFTGYYVPLLEGSREPSPAYPYPLYRRPEDMVKADLGLFNKEWKGRQLRGRLEKNELVPYFSRMEIDREGALKGIGGAFLWVDDYVDLFFLQIQGSGRVRLPSGELVNVGYGGKNGRPYASVGRLLVEEGKIRGEDVSMQSIKRYFREHPEDVEPYLFRNESYVFFRELPAGPFPFGSLNVPLTPGRSVAADEAVLPKGGLVYMESRKPVIDERGNIVEWVDFSRFAIDQDSGGAIKGPGRVDLFFGSGEYAEIAAGHFKQHGRIYYLARKEKG